MTATPITASRLSEIAALRDGAIGWFREALTELLAEVARLSDHSGILEFQRDAFHDQMTALRTDLAETRLVLEQQDRDLERQRAGIIALETGLRKIHDDALYDQNHERYLEIAAILDKGTP